MKKKILLTVVLTALAAFAAVVIAAYLTTAIVVFDRANSKGKHERTGSNKSTLQIVYTGTSSMGSCASYSISDNTVLTEYKEIDDRFIGNIRFGWKFKPAKAGSCILISEQYDGPHFGFADIYDVTVDDNLKISYTARRTDKFGMIESIRNTAYTGTFSVCSGGATHEIDGKAVFEELKDIYGENTECPQPDTESMTTVSIIRRYSSDDYTEYKFYTDGGKLYYLGDKFNAEKRERESCWYEFTPDEISSLDGLNEILAG